MGKEAAYTPGRVPRKGILVRHEAKAGSPSAASPAGKGMRPLRKGKKLLAGLFSWRKRRGKSKSKRLRWASDVVFHGDGAMARRRRLARQARKFKDELEAGQRKKKIERLRNAARQPGAALGEADESSAPPALRLHEQLEIASRLADTPMPRRRRAPALAMTDKDFAMSPTAARLDIEEGDLGSEESKKLFKKVRKRVKDAIEEEERAKVAMKRPRGPPTDAAAMREHMKAPHAAAGNNSNKKKKQQQDQEAAAQADDEAQDMQGREGGKKRSNTTTASLKSKRRNEPATGSQAHRVQTEADDAQTSPSPSKRARKQQQQQQQAEKSKGKGKKEEEEKKKEKKKKGGDVEASPAKNAKAQSKETEKSNQGNQGKGKGKAVLSEYQRKMAERLQGGQFRYINEQLYTTKSEDAVRLFGENPEMFDAYHAGFRAQVNKWPSNPLDACIKYVRAMPESYVVADMGCGEARLAASVPHKVHSFDLVAANETVTACDIAHVPLKRGAVDAVIFCLSLMGTNYAEFLIEANRILRPNGKLLIAEVESRIADKRRFSSLLRQIGFETKKVAGNTHFLLLKCQKAHESKVQATDLLDEATQSLTPCHYKRRG